MSEKTIRELSIELTLDITNICDGIKGRSVYVNQLMRACSSIGANASEGKYAQSRSDLINKLEIALKECYETEYWIEIMTKLGHIQDNQYKLLCNKCGTIRKKLIASISTAKQNLIN